MSELSFIASNINAVIASHINVDGIRELNNEHVLDYMNAPEPLPEITVSITRRARGRPRNPNKDPKAIQKKYREKHREKINAQKRTLWTCRVCNVSLTKVNKSKHEKGKYHNKIQLVKQIST
jgi:hypothetical protein